MNSRFIIFIGSVIFLVTGCKKETADGATSNNNGSTGPILFNGFFYFDQTKVWNNGAVVSTSYSGEAYLTSPAIDHLVETSASNQGTVSLNGVTMKFNSGSIKFYSDTTGTLDLSGTKNYQLNSTILPGFNVTFNDSFIPYPNTLAPSINDTLYRSNPLVIPLGPANNWVYFNCTLTDMANQANTVKKYAQPYWSSLTFSPSELNVFPIGANVLCTISVLRFGYSNKTGGTSYQFEINSHNQFNMSVQ